jgi:hypothetical protein
MKNEKKCKHKIERMRVEKKKAKRVVEDEEKDPRPHKHLLEPKTFGWKNEIRQKLFGQV